MDSKKLMIKGQQPKKVDCDAMWVKAGQESDEKMQPVRWTGPPTGPDKDLVRSHRPYPSLQSSGSFLARCVSTFSNKVAICASDRFSYVSLCSDKRNNLNR